MSSELPMPPRVPGQDEPVRQPGEPETGLQIGVRKGTDVVNAGLGALWRGYWNHGRPWVLEAEQGIELTYHGARRGVRGTVNWIRNETFRGRQFAKAVVPVISGVLAQSGLVREALILSALQHATHITGSAVRSLRTWNPLYLGAAIAEAGIPAGALISGDLSASNAALMSAVIQEGSTAEEGFRTAPARRRPAAPTPPVSQ